MQIGQILVGRWQLGGGLQLPLEPYLMLGICSLSVLESYMKHCLYILIMYGSETMLWKEKEISRIRAVQIDNLKRMTLEEKQS